MTQVHFAINDLDYMKFKQMVGEGNISGVLRSFVTSYIEKKNPKKSNIEKKFKKIEEEYKILKNQLDTIKFKEEEEMKKKKEFMKEQKQRFKEAEAKMVKHNLNKVF